MEKTQTTLEQVRQRISDLALLRYHDKLTPELLEELEHLKDLEVKLRTPSRWIELSNSQKIRPVPSYLPKLSGDNLICPHCGYTGRASVVSRWHYDKCRHKPPQKTGDAS